MAETRPSDSSAPKAPALALAAALVLLAGCGTADDGRTAATTTQAATVRVSERDFRISLSPRRVRPGRVRLVVDNKGPVNHELVVVKVAGRRLPLRGDGLTVDEDRLERRTAGVVEPMAPATSGELRLALTRGRYVLLCNMAGHYLSGMRAELVVQ